MLSEQDVVTSYWALLYKMNGVATRETTTSTEEQVGIVRGEARQSIKGETINGYGNRSQEGGASLEGIPVGVMVVGHGLLNYSNPFRLPFLYTLKSVKEVSLPTLSQTKDKTDGVIGTNMGLAKTTGDDMGCPGIGSSQMPTIRSLQTPFTNNAHTHQVKVLTETDVDGSSEE
jgi:hypothetical protein